MLIRTVKYIVMFATIVESLASLLRSVMALKINLLHINHKVLFMKKTYFNIPKFDSGLSGSSIVSSSLVVSCFWSKSSKAINSGSIFVILTKFV